MIWCSEKNGPLCLEQSTFWEAVFFFVQIIVKTDPEHPLVVITVCSELGPFVTVNLCDDTESRFLNSTTETQPQIRTQM